MTTLRTRLAAAGLGAGLALGAPGAAWAAPHRPIGDRTGTTATTAASAVTATTATTARTKTTPSAPAGRDLESLRSRCVAAIDVRLPALSAAKAALASAKRLTDDHRAALTALIDDVTTALESTRSEIVADTEADALRQHCRSIFESNRVFALVLPRTRLVVASDVSGAVSDKLDVLADKLNAAIADAEAEGRDVIQAKADLEALKAKITSSRTSAASLADAVLELTAADWNANHELLRTARQALQAARSDLRAARELAGKIRDELKIPKPQV